MEPGLRSAGLPMAGSSLPPALTAWRGSRPRARSCGAKASSVARLKPPKEMRRGDIDHARHCRRMAGSGAETPRVRSGSARATRGCAARLPRARGGGRADHVLDGPDAGDRIFGIRKRQGHGARQFAVDVDRAAAHSLHDAGMFERTAGEARQDEDSLGPIVIQHAEDFDLEFLDARCPRRRCGPMPCMPGRMSFSGKNEGTGLRRQHSRKREQNRRDHKTEHNTIVTGARTQI